MSSTEPPPNIPISTGIAGRRRGVIVLVLLVALVLFGLIGLAAATGWQETMAQISRLTWLQVAALLALSLINYSIRGWRWHIFARRLGLRTSFSQNFRHFIGGFAMTVTPGRVGELVRMRWIARETGVSFEKAAPLMLVDRASDMAGMAVLLGVSVAFSRAGVVGAIPVAILALIVALIATRPRLLAAVAGIGYRIVGRWARLFARVRTAARSLGRFSSPGVMTITTLIGAVGWFAEAYAFYLLLSWMGSDMGLATATTIFVFALMVGGLTGTPGGVGGTDAAMVALLSLQGVPLVISLPATAIIRFTTLWFAIGIGLIVFPYAESKSKKVADALEKNRI